MLWFVLGFIAVHSVLFVWSWGSQPAAVVALDPVSGTQLASLLVLIPASCPWATACISNTILPRRAFDKRLRHRWPPLLCRGLAAGILSTVIGAMLVNFADEYAGDAVLLGAAATLAAAAFTAPLPRLRPGLCVHCLYNLEGIPPNAPCPECGVIGGG